MLSVVLHIAHDISFERLNPGVKRALEEVQRDARAEHESLCKTLEDIERRKEGAEGDAVVEGLVARLREAKIGRAHV